MDPMPGAKRGIGQTFCTSKTRLKSLFFHFRVRDRLIPIHQMTGLGEVKLNGRSFLESTAKMIQAYRGNVSS